MPLNIKQGTTAYNPRVVTEGLIFYIDPNNTKCRTLYGDKFISLIQPFSNIADLSAGILTSNTKSLTSVGGNYFIELSGANFLSGNIGPDYALSGLDNFTLQFWFKNNKPTATFKNILTNSDINVINLIPNTDLVTVSTNYPYSRDFGTAGINGVYTLQDGLIDGKRYYERRVPIAGTTRPFLITWDGSNEQWSLKNDSPFATHFISKDNVDNPSEASWYLTLTAFKFNTGDMPINFFGNSTGNVLNEIFYPTVSGESGLAEYRTRPWVPQPFTIDSRNSPVVSKINNEPWAFYTYTFQATYTAVNVSEYPWDFPTFNFNSNLSALSCNTNLNYGDIVLSGGWIAPELANDRPIYYRDVTPIDGGYLNRFGFISYEPTGVGSGAGWYVTTDTGIILLSSNNPTQYIWEINDWVVYPNIFPGSITPYFSVVKFDPPPITATPLYPENYSNTSIIVSANTFEIPNKGFYLSGTDNFIDFAYNDITSLSSKRTLFQTNTGVWNCVTLAQSNQEVTLYKNSNIQDILHTETKYFNLSSMYFGNNITLGQVFLYDRYLPYGQVRQNYNSFKSRYKTDDVFPSPSIFNWILNSKFDADNHYPISDGSRFFDGNYFSPGPDAGSSILTNYIHNSPLLYEYDSGTLYSYYTFANRTFHQISSPYSILLLNHAPQPRLLKMFGVGSRFFVPNSFYGTNGDHLRTITSTTNFNPTNIQSWVKYGVAQYISIPPQATKIIFGVTYLVQGDDKFRTNNFGGINLSFRNNGYRSYVNVYVVHTNFRPANLATLENLYSLNDYTDFNADLGQNAMCQWMGPSNSRVKVRKLAPFDNLTTNNKLDKFNTVSFMVDIPTFSTTSVQPDSSDGFAQDVCLEMFFAEFLPLLNNDGSDSGSIYFYEPFLYFK